MTELIPTHENMRIIAPTLAGPANAHKLVLSSSTANAIKIPPNKWKNVRHASGVWAKEIKVTQNANIAE